MSLKEGLAAVDSETVSKNLPGELLVIQGAVLISFSPIFVRISSAGPTMAGFYRTLFGGIILTIIVIVRGERLRTEFTSLKQAFVAALLFALGLTFWHRSIMVVGPGLSTILANFQVFFLSAMGIVFLKERLRLRTAVAIPLAIIGVCLLVGEERITIDLSYRTGVVFGLLAALAYALYLMALRNLQAGKKTSAQMANFALVSLTCAAIMGVEGWWQGESFAIMDIHSWLSMMAYGMLCQALAWILISAGLPRIEASRAGLILLLQPTGAFVWDILFFGRPTTGLEFCGAGLTLAAIYLGTTHK